MNIFCSMTDRTVDQMNYILDTLKCKKNIHYNFRHVSRSTVDKFMFLTDSFASFKSVKILYFMEIKLKKGGGATVLIFITQLRSVFPGPPIYFTDFIFCMVISYYHIRMGI